MLVLIELTELTMFNCFRKTGLAECQNCSEENLPSSKWLKGTNLTNDCTFSNLDDFIVIYSRGVSSEILTNHEFILNTTVILNQMKM